MRVKLSNYRRVIQAFFFILFLVLLSITAKQIVIPFPAQLFLVSDPLIALATLAAGLPAVSILFYSIITAAITLLFGRVFCGYACPMGTFLDLFGPLAKLLRVNQKSFRKLKVLPLIILFLVLGASFFQNNILMSLDPIVLLTRTLAVTLFPALNFIITQLFSPFYGSPLAPTIDGFKTGLSGILVFDDARIFADIQWIVILFISVISLNTLGKRFWCRYLCPLGGLLGLIGRVPLYRRRVDATACTSCLSCTKACEMDAVANEGLATDAANCVMCMRCRDKCPKSAISWGLKPELTTEIPSRRTAILAVGGSIAAAYLAPLNAGATGGDATLLRPPGAQEEDEFLKKCIRCGQCLKACPTNVLQPALLQYGLDSLWTPHLNYKVGTCDWKCNACTRACPTGAIEHLSLKAKQKFVIGRAQINRHYCYPWIAGHGCQVCYDVCPLPEKAILLRDTGRYDPTGIRVVLPYVKRKKCIGCGICEANCPVKAETKAITVFQEV